jgi:hypothetical protein
LKPLFSYFEVRFVSVMANGVTRGTALPATTAYRTVTKHKHYFLDVPADGVGFHTLLLYPKKKRCFLLSSCVSVCLSPVLSSDTFIMGYSSWISVCIIIRWRLRISDKI